ncbi:MULTISPECIES: hypothetical protein [Saccharopolyspora]|uniref:Uncharacterized protein n=1 Tax=Saccharopolyspora gregorii TaxID=33914 RepID=A0ABP6S095_9PSEU|nr:MULTISPECIES: hypothetical protein [Saccharopolyspora]MCA1188412.1 hypothetical protein [Saccharopolyspora sp. 6T]MCA1194822.1 hypothetical protein [Saccharopolyspora sp. 6V]MCA1228971.1 hypothetical protein [Saccharopolyspora sp. 6M]MCA1281276.1 hypothetical protein [Saccharopolyspora sp. 7B]
MAGAALLLLALIAIVMVLLAPDRHDDADDHEVRIPAPRAEGELGSARPGAVDEKERA